MRHARASRRYISPIRIDDFITLLWQMPIRMVRRIVVIMRAEIWWYFYKEGITFNLCNRYDRNAPIEYSMIVPAYEMLICEYKKGERESLNYQARLIISIINGLLAVEIYYSYIF